MLCEFINQGGEFIIMSEGREGVGGPGDFHDFDASAAVNMTEVDLHQRIEKGSKTNGGAENGNSNEHTAPATGKSYHETTYGTSGVHDPNAPRLDSGFRDWFAIKPE